MHRMGVNARHDLLHAEHPAIHLLAHIAYVRAAAGYVLVLLEAVLLVLVHLFIGSRPCHLGAYQPLGSRLLILNSPPQHSRVLSLDKPDLDEAVDATSQDILGHPYRVAECSIVEGCLHPLMMRLAPAT